MMRTIFSFQVISFFNKVSLSMAIITLLLCYHFPLFLMRFTIPKLTKCLLLYPWSYFHMTIWSCLRKHSESVKIVPKLDSGVYGFFPWLRYPMPKSLCLVPINHELFPILKNKHYSIHRSHTTDRSLFLISEEVQQRSKSGKEKVCHCLKKYA